jgi:hypothetical protein
MMEVLDNIPVNLEPERVLRRLRLREPSEYIARTVRELAELARSVAKPKAVYRVCYLENRAGDSLEIGGVRFTSRLLRFYLDNIERVFPYIVTCGRELDEIAIPSDDFTRRYYLDAIKEMAMRSALGYLEDYLKAKYALGQLSRISPGSLESWPLTQQRELFGVLGDVRALVGVELNESCLMIPLKSVSGILFPTQVEFEGCRLCPREDCRERRAPYDPELAKKHREGID